MLDSLVEDKVGHYQVSDRPQTRRLWHLGLEWRRFSKKSQDKHVNETRKLVVDVGSTPTGCTSIFLKGNTDTIFRGQAG